MSARCPSMNSPALSSYGNGGEWNRHCVKVQVSGYVDYVLDRQHDVAREKHKVSRLLVPLATVVDFFRFTSEL